VTNRRDQDALHGGELQLVRLQVNRILEAAKVQNSFHTFDSVRIVRIWNKDSF
jgi:hypothetical protein